MLFASAANARRIVAVQGTAKQLGLFSDTEEPGEAQGLAVRESARAKRLSIKVFPRGRVEVVVPRRTRPEVVQAFISEHRDWIHRSREAFAKLHPPEPFLLPNMIDLKAIGQSFRIRYERQAGKSTVRFRCNNNIVVLSGRTGDDKLCIDALKRWLASTAKSEIGPRLKTLSVSTGSAYKRMHVRGQRTCWGSHSSRGTISYLMIHELCHARHMNHSRRFWQRVGRFEPDYKRLDKALGDSWRQIPSWLGIY